MGGEQNTASEITKLVPNSTVLPSFAFKGVDVDASKGALVEWLNVIGLK
jgi:hypothetical protein